MSSNLRERRLDSTAVQPVLQSPCGLCSKLKPYFLPFTVIDIPMFFLLLLTQRSRVRFPALPDFLNGSGSGTGSTEPL
jgi:hypothetical protein